MNISQALELKCISAGSGEKTREELLKGIALLASDSSSLGTFSSDEILKALIKREELASTGFGNGAAIPHCRLEKASGFILGFIITSEGIDFNSPDNKPVDLFPFVIGPSDKPREHLKLLSFVAQILRDKVFRTSLREADSPEQIYNLLLKKIPAEDSAPVKRPGMKLLHVFIQEEKAFEDILQVFAAIESTSAMVIDAVESTSYLSRIPLFAGLWDTDNRSFNRIIVASIRDELVNAAIRNIEYACGKLNERRDLMITVSDLHYVLGTLED